MAGEKIGGTMFKFLTAGLEKAFKGLVKAEDAFRNFAAFLRKELSSLKALMDEFAGGAIKDIASLGIQAKRAAKAVGVGIEELSSSLQAAGKESEGAGAALAGSFASIDKGMEGLTGGTTELAEKLKSVKDDAEKAYRAIAKLREESSGFDEPFESEGAGIRELLDEFSEKLKGLKSLAQIRFTSLKEDVENLGGNLKNAATKGKKMASVCGDIGASASGIRQTGENLKKVRPAEGQNEALSKAEETLGKIVRHGKEMPTGGVPLPNAGGKKPAPEVMTDFEGFASGLEPTEGLLERWQTFAEGFKGVMKGAADYVEDYFGSTGKMLGGLAEDLGKVFLEFLDDIEDALAGAFYRMMAEGQNFKEAMKEMWEEIKKAAFKAVSSMAAKAILSFAKILAFEEGGVASRGAGSLPRFDRGGFAWGEKLPRAQHGLLTRGSGPIPAILHPDEVVLPLRYIRDFFGTVAERMFANMSLPAIAATPVPVLQTPAPTKEVNINLNIGASNFDDPGYWRDLFRTKIKPVMEDVEYGRI